MEVKRGVIKGFQGSWGSGIGFLLVKDSDTGMVEQIPCDNASTVRALEGAFGDVIGDNHSVSENPGFMDQEIYWSMDEIGLTLEAFTPVEEASEELLEYYESQA